MSKTVLVTGASGFIGSHLCTELTEHGHQVRAMTRHPESYRGAGLSVFADVADPESLANALGGAEIAYYLVHSLASDNFAERDAEAAVNFGHAAAAAGVSQIIYLGGLGAQDANLSEHLRSRREVEGLLARGGVPVTVLRAAVVIGDGSISWEITRQLVDHLPVMVTPKWAKTRTQPIALEDVIRYLVGVLAVPETFGQVYEIGGADVLRYLQMMRRAAWIQRKPLFNVSVPLLTPGLSSRWLSLVTDVDTTTARNLIDSMVNEVVVNDDSIRTLLPGEPLGYDEAVRRALAAREARLSAAAT